MLNVNINWEDGEEIVMKDKLNNEDKMDFDNMDDIDKKVINKNDNFGINNLLIDKIKELENEKNVIERNNKKNWRKLINVKKNNDGDNEGNIEKGRFKGGY